MKLLYMTPGIFNSGGTERILSMKVNYLIEKYGYEIVIVTTDQKNRSCFYDFDNSIKHYDLDLNYEEDIHLSLFHSVIVRFRKNRIYRQKLRAIIHQEKPDICISMFGKEYEFLPDMRLDCKIVAELHFNQNFRNSMYMSMHSGILWKMISRFRTYQMIRNSRRYDKLVVLTKEDEFKWKKTNNNVVQIYNPLPIEQDRCSDLRSKSMIAVGRLSAQKDFGTLIDVWFIVHAHHPDWVLNIWGNGEEKEYLIRKIKSLELENSCFLRGVTRDINEEYLKNSVYVMTSRYEGFPMVLLEASSFGLPLVSFDCECGPKDMIVDGVNGFVISNRDKGAMADAICQLIEDNELLRQMGNHSKQISRLYSKEMIFPKWQELFRNFSHW